MAKKNKGRDLSGILLLDKPLGLSSNQALQHIKTLYQAQKAGHTGSLDPLATGVLPICLGEATKFSQYLLNADKVYVTRIKLGEKTTTGDSEGDIIEQRPVDFAFEMLVEVLSQFTGELTQIPSMYSAIKHKGQPLYKLARKGVEIERAARNIVVNELKLVSERTLFEEKQEIDLYVHCSKGTYIRNLGEDIGEAAGCGAHLRALRRIKAGQFEEMHSLEGLKLYKDDFEKLDAFLLPVDAALYQFPNIELDEEQAAEICFGRHVQIVNHNSFEGIVRVYSKIDAQTGSEARFLGLGELHKAGVLSGKRLLRTN